MYGREANCAHLLEDVPFSDDEDDESNEVCSIDSQTDWMESLMDTRTESRTQAHENIRDEQLQQKCVFDNKVKRNRYGLILVVIIRMLLNDYNIFVRTEIKQGDHILVRNIRKEKKLPGSKEENKYIGPMIATDVTENHVIV